MAREKIRAGEDLTQAPMPVFDNSDFSLDEGGRTLRLASVSRQNPLLEMDGDNLGESHDA